MKLNQFIQINNSNYSNFLIKRRAESLNVNNAIENKAIENKNNLILKTSQTNPFYSLESIKNYNLAFLGKKLTGPVYAIDKEGNASRFKNQTKAAQELGIGLSGISQVLSGFLKQTGGFTFILASDVETIKDGKIDIDQEALDNICNNFVKENEKYLFYSINIKTKECKGFKNQSEAARKLELQPRSIGRCLAKDGMYQTGGFMFAYANDIEIIDKEGNISIDMKKVDKMIKSRENEPFYAVSPSGQYYKFNRRIDATTQLGISSDHIYECLRGKRAHNGGYAFIYAKKLEIKNEDGTISINQKKLENLIKKIKSNEVYIVDMFGNYTKCKTKTEAAEILKVNNSTVGKNVAGQIYTVGGCKVVDAKRLEIKNPDGSITINQAEIVKIMKKFVERAVYVVDSKGEYIRKDSKCTAARDKAGVYFSFSLGKFVPLNGFNCISAKLVEKVTDDKQILLNEEKLQKEIDYYQKKAVYVVNNQDGSRERYNNIILASLFSDGVIYDPATRTHSPNKNYAIIKAGDVEDKDANNIYSLNEEKLKRILQQLCSRPVA